MGKDRYIDQLDTQTPAIETRSDTKETLKIDGPIMVRVRFFRNFCIFLNTKLIFCEMFFFVKKIRVTNIVPIFMGLTVAPIHKDPM